MSVVPENMRRPTGTDSNGNTTYQYGSASRNTDTYPSNSVGQGQASYYADINAGKFAITLADGTVIQASYSGGYGQTLVQPWNRSVAMLAVEWSNGLARLTHPNKQGNWLYCISGDPEIANLSTDYQYSPGTSLTINAINGLNTLYGVFGFAQYQRVSFNINIGNPPS